MSAKRLRRLGLDPAVLERFTKQHIHTCKDVISRHPLELQQALGLAYADVQQIQWRVCRAVAPAAATGLAMWLEECGDARAYLGTDLTDLDRVLHGGLPTRTIAEVAGPSGCGKTQLCIQLSVLGALPVQHGGLGGNVVYIDTECTFSAERLVEIAENRFPEVYNNSDSLLKLAEQVHVHTESSCSSLMKRLENLEEELISRQVKLLIVDSVASLVRKEFDPRRGQNIAERTKLLTKQAALLKYIAETFNIPVVVTNQITTRFSSDKAQVDVQDLDKTDEPTVPSSDGYVTAALGTTWSHCVNTRLILQYLDGPRRQVLVAKSPIAPFAMFAYTIQASGLVMEDGGADHYKGTDPSLQKIRVRSAIKQDPFHY